MMHDLSKVTKIYLVSGRSIDSVESVVGMNLREGVPSDYRVVRMVNLEPVVGATWTDGLSEEISIIPREQIERFVEG